MATTRSEQFLQSLLRELCNLPRETEWVEFKENFVDYQQIGEYISAIANSAALVGKAFGYLVWGVRDADHSVVGTNFKPKQERIGNEELENWLLHQMAPKIHFCFYEVLVNGAAIIFLEIGRAMRNPVAFQGQEYIRVGSYKKKLKDFPEKERSLWRIFDAVPFESNSAADNLDDAEVLTLFDVASYFDLLAMSLPESKKATLAALQSDNLICPNAAGKWDVTNLGAILFAKRLGDFGPLKRKAVRVIQYKGNSRVETVKEHEGHKGYGSGFEGFDLLSQWLIAHQ